MPTDLKTRCVTPRGRLSYPAIFRTAEVMNEGDTPKFQAEVIFPESQDISELRQAVKNCLKNKFGTEVPHGLKMPFRNGSERVDDKGNIRDGYDNSIFICPRSTDKPGVVIGRDKEICTNENDVYGGCYVRVSVTAYYYEKGRMSRGVAFALNHVWKVSDGEPFATRISAEDDFDSVEVSDDEFDEESGGYDPTENEDSSDGGSSLI